VAIALLLSAAELTWPVKVRSLAEPTRSLGAIGLVLAGHAITDAARFLILALAAALGSPVLVGAGGAAGCAAVVLTGWLIGPSLTGHRVLRPMRIGIAVAFVIAGVLTGLSARGTF
jgi:O-antigen ligase